jgi:2,4-dienoyl-CoA reductase-like NADH-dependent reductase (Old Yellow Enzyme family)
LIYDRFVNERSIVRLASIKSVAQFRELLVSLSVDLPCDEHLITGADSPLRQPLGKIGNRIAVQPMEGWDGGLDGSPSENTLRRWRRFGQSGAKLIWGGEAVAISHEGRANPHQLMMAPHTEKGIAELRAALIEEHRRVTGSEDGLLIGLQLTHSGRYCRPNLQKKSSDARTLYRHPILDRRLGLDDRHALLRDGDIASIIEGFHAAAVRAWKLGFDFVDVKHCHGYLGHEFLSAFSRPGIYGGSFEGRTRFLREIVQGIRSLAPGLEVGVRLSAFDTVPFFPDPLQSSVGKPGQGIPEPCERPYQCGFGVEQLGDAEQFLTLLEGLGIRLVNITGGSPYYNPHIQRPAVFPPSDGYLPPEDPLVGVARQMDVTRRLKQRFPDLIFVGSAYSYLQEFLPNVAQAALREGWTDFVGLGRMVLSYPQILWDATEGNTIQRKKICRTFSDCTTAPRNGLPSGCYPLDSYYKNSEAMVRLNAIKHRDTE